MHNFQNDTLMPPEDEAALLEAHSYLPHLPGFLLLSCGRFWVSPALRTQYPELGEGFSAEKLLSFLPKAQRTLFKQLLKDPDRLLALFLNQSISLKAPLDGLALAIRQLYYLGQPNWMGVLYSLQSDLLSPTEIQTAPPLLPTDYEFIARSDRFGFWRYDIATRRVYFSEAIYPLLGYQPWEISTPVALVTAEDYALIRVIVLSMMKTRTPELNRMEVRFRHKSGQLIPVLFTIQSEGTKLLGTFESVEEPAALREALNRVAQKAEQRSNRFKTLFDTLPEMVFIADKQTGVLLNFNETVEEKLGYEPSELIGQHFSILLPETDKLEGIKNFNSGQRADRQAVYPLKARDGSIVDTQVSETDIMYEDTQARLAIFSDKTTLLKAEQRAERRERQFRQLVTYSSDLITVSSTSLHIEWVSDNSEHIIGYTPKELGGTKLHDFIHPDDLKEATDLILTSIEENKPEFSYTARFLHKNGHYRWLSNHIIRTTNEEGHPIGITYSRDITPQLELQKKRTEMDRLKQEFVSMSSHQLRTPMAVFSANLEMLMETEEAKSPLLKRILSRMERESNRMIRLIDDVLAVSQLNTNDELLANKVEIEIVSFIRKILADEAFYFNDAPIALHTELQRGTIKADQEQLTHMLHNLLSNAIKYSERRDPPEVRIRVVENARIRVDIIDQGVGIPEEDLPQLFQQFHRASNVKKIAGTGLGLYIVKQFADANGIAIEVYSKEDIGTTFSLAF